MTNEELDRWLAERVMGWHFVEATPHLRISARWRGDDGLLEYTINDWHPTTKIAQAIEAAEKARTKGRIGDWVLLSPAGNTISRPMAEITLDGGFFFSSDADAYSLALCRAIHEALRDRT